MIAITLKMMMMMMMMMNIIQLNLGLVVYQANTISLMDYSVLIRSSVQVA